MFPSSIGWSSIAQVIGWLFYWIHLIHSGVVEKHLGSSTDESTSAINDEKSPIVQVFPRNSESSLTTHSGDYSSEGVSPIESLNNPAGSGENADANASDSDEEDDIPAINDVGSLKMGIIKTSNNKTNAPYTILLVGETGVGKSSVLELFANVLAGKDIDHTDFDTLDPTTEQPSSNNQSPTTSTRLYEFKSNNGIVVRILNTPGLVDPRNIQQDELYDNSIMAHIKEHVDSLTAVLVLANGTLPSITVGTDYALSTLTAILPDTLANHIGFMLTNVSNPLYQNFSTRSIPDILKYAPQFLLDNPIPLQRNYLRLRDVPNMKKRRTEMREAVKTGEEKALEMLVDLFDWLDGLERQPTTEIASLYATSWNTMTMTLDPLARLVGELLRKIKEKVSGKSSRH